jgi:hypothetical protein
MIKMYNYKVKYTGNNAYQYEIFNKQGTVIVKQEFYKNAHDAELFAKIHIKKLTKKDMVA